MRGSLCRVQFHVAGIDVLLLRQPVVARVNHANAAGHGECRGRFAPLAVVGRESDGVVGGRRTLPHGMNAIDVVVVAKVDYNLGIVCMVDRIGRLGIFPLCTFVAVDGVLRVGRAVGARCYRLVEGKVLTVGKDVDCNGVARDVARLQLHVILAARSYSEVVAVPSDFGRTVDYPFLFKFFGIGVAKLVGGGDGESVGFGSGALLVVNVYNKAGESGGVEDGQLAGCTYFTRRGSDGICPR